MVRICGDRFYLLRRINDFLLLIFEKKKIWTRINVANRAKIKISDVRRRRRVSVSDVDELILYTRIACEFL